MTLFNSASIEIVNSQPNLSDEALERFQIALQSALELAAEECMDAHGITQEGMPTVILSDFYQSGGDSPETPSSPS